MMLEEFKMGQGGPRREQRRSWMWQSEQLTISRDKTDGQINENHTLFIVLSQSSSVITSYFHLKKDTRAKR